MPPSKFYLIEWFEIDGGMNRRTKKAIVVEIGLIEAMEKLKRETQYPLRKEFEILSIIDIGANMFIQ